MFVFTLCSFTCCGACSVHVDNFPWIGSHPVWTSIWHSSQGWELLCESSFSVCACVRSALNYFLFLLTDWSSVLEAQLILLLFVVVVSVCVWRCASDRRAGGLHSSRGRLGLGSGGRGLYQHWLLLCLPKSITVFFKEIEVIFNATSSQVSWISSIMLAVMYAGGQFHLLLSLLSILVLYLFISLWVLNWEFTFYCLFCKLHINTLSYNPMGYFITMIISVWRSRKKYI